MAAIGLEKTKRVFITAARPDPGTAVLLGVSGVLNGDFVLVTDKSGCYLQAHGLEQLVEVIDDALIELVELRTLLLLEARVAGGDSFMPLGMEVARISPPYGVYMVAHRCASRPFAPPYPKGRA